MTRFAVWLVAWLQTTRGLWILLVANTAPAIAALVWPSLNSGYTALVSYEAIVLSLLILVGQGVEGRALHLKLDGLIEGVPDAKNELRGIEKLPPAKLADVIEKHERT